MAAWRSPHDPATASHLGKVGALSWAIGLSVAAFGLQIVGSWYTGSLALLGDSFHLLTDLFSLVMSLAAVILASRPTTQGRSFGFFRLEVLASFVNGLLLLLVALGLAKEGVERLLHPEPVLVTPLIVVAAIGLACNLLSAFVLLRASKDGELIGHQHHGHDHGHDHGHGHEHGHGHGPAQEHEHEHGDGCDHGHGHAHLDAHHHDRNLRSALLHVWSDALNSVAVILGGVVMRFTGWFWVDALVGLGIALWILRWAWHVILDSTHVLLESTPHHVKTEKVVAGLRRLDGRVVSVDDLHVWELTSRMYAATAEVRVKAMDLGEAEQLRLKMHEWLHDQFGIAHVVLAIRPE